ncbi:MAG: hypothetical protein ACLT8E_05130 [Akkermansia sp.]
MLLHFYKMTGAGNDFVMVDNRDLSLSSVLDKETIEALCDRRFGISDGLIAVEPSRGKGEPCACAITMPTAEKRKWRQRARRRNLAAALLHHDKSAPSLETMSAS